MKGNILLITTLITGLSAGLFYAWQVSVIPGTRKISDLNYLESMQSINREILNPWFFIIFLGPLILMVISGIGLHRIDDSQSFAWVLIASLVYIIGTVGVTALGNVPMNNRLDIIELSKLSIDQLQATRRSYEFQWNQYHLIRTAFSVISFSLLLWATKTHFINTNFINH
ncbi:DUF1772 domain-containing protein [Roseivirga sp. E12]|uniref:anthrone oxygenase family protein n=1 Tax=Roseivirga sp. E12 TaxID=2819237 RepID=UPI001ABCBB64|nr:DUF1772 domain-containing protein [Roseivirga sp. E12]MBO3697942.1 DUF1772 domain-containing protein [Roseivirga sp. E12]